MTYNIYNLTPIINLFNQLPEGTGKVALFFALAMGIGALITIKTKDVLIKDDYFISWDD
jgi:hypothetical protein